MTTNHPEPSEQGEPGETQAPPALDEVTEDDDLAVGEEVAPEHDLDVEVFADGND